MGKVSRSTKNQKTQLAACVALICRHVSWSQPLQTDLVPNIERNAVCNATTELFAHSSQLVCPLVVTGSMVTCACALALPSKISASSSGTLCMVGEEYNFKTKISWIGLGKKKRT